MRACGERVIGQEFVRTKDDGEAQIEMLDKLVRHATHEDAHIATRCGTLEQEAIDLGRT